MSHPPPMMSRRGGGPPMRDERDGKPPSWRERAQALRYVPALLRLVWESHRGYTTTMVLLRVVRAFIPVASLWVAKLIIDEVVRLAGSSGPRDLGTLWRLVALELVIVVLGEVIARASALVESLLGDLFSNRMSIRLMEHAATLDLAQFEDPVFYDHLERARRSTTGRLALLTQLTTIAQDLLTLATLGTALVVYSPWLLLLLAAAVIPAFLGESHFAALGYSLLWRRTPERRQLDYLRYVGASDVTAKEVQLFGLAPWLIERYRILSERFYDENKELATKRAFVSTLLSIVGTLGYYGAYVSIVLGTVRGAITVGTLTFLAGSFARSRDLIQRLLLGASDVHEQALYLRDLFLFFEMQPTITTRSGATPVPRPFREGFVFEDVGFRYPGSDRWAVRHVDLRIRPGESVALVGENGAGKTTLTKLLARLYDPTEGRVLLDGVDLRDYDLTDLRRAIGVIFQDFVRYDMAFDENVGVGEIEEVRGYLEGRAGPSPRSRERSERLSGPARDTRSDGGGAGSTVRDLAPTGAARLRGDSRDDAGSPTTPSSPPAPLAAAAERSLAASLLPRFPNGYRQMLGRRFEGGVNLSGGEWQKVALARAYMREAELLILDEPTAALDARAEYEVFERFAQLMHGRTAVVISHRFSTVRMADRIVVLGDGRVLEEGSHDELVARGGLYAELFALQAAGYR